MFLVPPFTGSISILSVLMFIQVRISLTGTCTSVHSFERCIFLVPMFVLKKNSCSWHLRLKEPPFERSRNNLAVTCCQKSVSLVIKGMFALVSKLEYSVSVGLLVEL